MNPNSDYLYSEARKLLDQKRLSHTEGVIAVAKTLALQYGADPEKAEIAALLHDITKKLDYNQQIELAEKLGIEFSDDTKSAFKTMHSVTAAAYSEKELGIKDKEILDAIRYHTTLRAEMTLLDKIVYIADFIEPGRTFEGVDKARMLIASSLDDTCIYCLKFTINEIMENKRPIHKDTVLAFNYMITHKGENNG